MHLHADGGRILKCLHQRYIKRLANRNDVRRNVSLRVLENGYPYSFEGFSTRGWALLFQIDSP